MPSIHGECFDNGSSERCSPAECDLFFCGDCKDPGMVMDHTDLNSLDDKEWQRIREVYPDTYELFYTNFKKENTMSKSEELKKMSVQQHDRTKAAKKLEDKVKSLTSRDLPRVEDIVFDQESCTELFSYSISVPVKVVCLETEGVRRVFVNGFEIHASNLCVLASKSLIDCFGKVEEAVTKIDSALGCENLNKLL
jgi:hypothetical protein